MINTVKCPKCGEEVEISKAIFDEQLNVAVKEAAQDADKKAREKMGMEMKAKEDEAKEEQKRNKDLQEQIGDLLKQMRDLKHREQEQELVMAKKLAAEEDKIREEAAKQERGKTNLEVQEIRKKLSDTQQALTDAQTKAKQGSQQLQGEVLELDMEEKLKAAFIYDEITPIGKGIEGGDIVQKVKNTAGKTAGTILWETKRAKWQPTWISKLKEDGRNYEATLVVLVTVHLPDDIDNFSIMDNVIITSQQYAIALASVLRIDIMRIASAKYAAENKDEKLESLYRYLQGEAFRTRFEVFAEGMVTMQSDLLNEKRSMEKSWKSREMQISRSISNISKMYGELQGIMGTALPDIKILALKSGLEEEIEKGN